MILALDTSGRYAVVAVAATDGSVPFARAGSTPRAHAEELGPLVRAALQCGPVTHVVAGRGPGSFTGLRVGLAFGQILAFALGVPATGLCSLDVVATAAGARFTGFAVVDARRGEVYLARYAEGARLGEPEVLTRGAALRRVGSQPVVGDVALLSEPDRRAAGDTVLDPVALADSAQAAVTAGIPDGLQPLYLRRPDVTLSAGHRGGP